MKHCIPLWDSKIFTVSQIPIDEKLPASFNADKKSQFSASYFVKSAIHVNSIAKHPTEPENYVLINETIDFPRRMDEPDKLAPTKVFYSSESDADTVIENLTKAEFERISTLLDFYGTQAKMLSDILENKKW